jgi:hypothetical protein
MTPPSPGPPRPRGRPELSVARVLAWADDCFARTGDWPHLTRDPIPGTGGETWRKVDGCLRRGGRGLPGGTTLYRLLAEHRGVRNPNHPPPLTVPRVLAWADAYHEATGGWPSADSGPVAQAPGETWAAADSALRCGVRGLPGGSSLAKVLAEYRGVRNPRDLPRLLLEDVLAWADEHRRRTGRWPTARSGPIPGAPLGETWGTVDTALRDGLRGLPGRLSVARLLAWHRGARNPKGLPRLRVAQVLAWADAHRARTGRWPRQQSGPVAGAPAGTTWAAIDAALREGLRGLPGGSSLGRLLEQRRGAGGPGRARGDGGPPGPAP